MCRGHAADCVRLDNIEPAVDAHDIGRTAHCGGSPLGIHHTRLTVASNGSRFPSPPLISGSHLADPVVVSVGHVEIIVRIDAYAVWTIEPRTASDSIHMPGLAAATHRHNFASLQGYLANAIGVDHEQVVVAIHHECTYLRKACRLA